MAYPIKNEELRHLFCLNAFLHTHLFASEHAGLSYIEALERLAVDYAKLAHEQIEEKARQIQESSPTFVLAGR